MKPTIGRIVWYRTDGRNGLVYDLPAVITVTKDTHPGDYPDGARNPLPVPEEGYVHLTVFTPGGFGTYTDKTPLASRPGDDDFPDATTLTPGSGTYVEWNVPFDPEASPRSWRWPELV